MVLRNLTEQQRTERRDESANLLEEIESDPDLLHRIITCDESWFLPI